MLTQVLYNTRIFVDRYKSCKNQKLNQFFHFLNGSEKQFNLTTEGVQILWVKGGRGGLILKPPTPKQ